jgi:hypothetical protein
VASGARVVHALFLLRRYLPRPGVPLDPRRDPRAPSPGRRLRDGRRVIPRSPKNKCARTPSTCTAPTATSPNRSSKGWPNSVASGSRSPRVRRLLPAVESEYLGMVVATEELSWGSLGIGGSLITRPEIMTRALVYGGNRPTTEEAGCPAGQRRDALRHRGHRARLRFGRGRDRHHAPPRPTVVGSSTGPRPGAPSRRAPTCWCCWRAPTPTAPAPTGDSRSSWWRSPAATVTASSSPGRRRRRTLATPTGRLEGRPIDTIGYRGMHSYELSLRELVRPGRQPDRRGRTGQGLLLPDGRLRERPHPNGGAASRGHAGGLRRGARVRRTRVVFGRPSSTLS